MALRISRKFIPWILHHVWEFKWYYVGALISLYVLQVFQVQIPERIRTLTELMGVGKGSDVSVLVFLGLALGILVFRTASRLLFFYPARLQQKLLRMEIIDLFEKVTPARYNSKNQGQIFQILFDDVNNLRAFVGFGLLQVANLIIAAWVLIPKMNQTDSYLWPAFIPLFSSVILFSIMTMINQKLFKRMMEKKGEVQQFIIESYEAKQTIKNFHKEDEFINGFVKASKDELLLFFKTSVGFAFTEPYIRLGLGASLLWGGFLIKANGGGPSDLVFFSGFLYLFLEPVMFLSWVAMVISQGFAAWKRIRELYQLLVTPSDREILQRSFEVIEGANTLSVENTFWDKIQKIKIKTQEWSVLAGETGSGKTFLLSQIAETLKMKERKVSLVQQEPYLFNDTIAENVFLGKEPDENNIKDLKELLQIFQLTGLAPTLDGVINLEVGENGKRVSGGQMKRIALIRSLMSDADFYIWDDPFSSVDVILEKKIIDKVKLHSRWKEKTFFFSSHRLTTVKHSDALIFISKGKELVSFSDTKIALKDETVNEFFKEQSLEASLA